MYKQERRDGSGSYGYPSSSVGHARSNQPKKKDEYLEQRFLLPTINADYVIGPNGNNLKRLHMQYCAMINISDTSTSERILTLGGFDLSTMCNTLQDIIEGLQNSLEKGGYMITTEPSIGLLLDELQVDYLTSIDEYKLNQILEDTETNIDVFLMCCPQSSDRVIRIRGQPSNIVQCIYSFYDVLQWCSTQRSRTPYNADNASEVYAADYGGYTRIDAVQEPVDAVQEPVEADAATEDMDISFEEGETASVEGEQHASDDGKIDEEKPDLPSNPTTTTTTTIQVSIQSSLVDIILGKNGSRLKQIREESNASIHLHDSNPSSLTNLISISGTPEEMENAKELLKICIRYFCVRLN